MFSKPPLTTLSRCWARKFLSFLPLARVASGPWGRIRARSEKRIMSWDRWIIEKKDDDCLTDWPLKGIVTWFWTGFRPHTWHCSRSEETKLTSRRAQLHKRNIFNCLDWQAKILVYEGSLPGGGGGGLGVVLCSAGCSPEGGWTGGKGGVPNT